MASFASRLAIIQYHQTARESLPFMKGKVFLEWIEPFDLEFIVPGGHASTNRLSQTWVTH